ncbi:MAG: hypothetical protein IK132_10625 [Clostridia bacterium]|nr:hypothetical protein [Clostridia bacterium]
MRRVSLFLAAVMLFVLVLPACHKSENTPTHGAVEVLSAQSSGSGERFAADPFPFPDDYSLILGGAHLDAAGDLFFAAVKQSADGTVYDYSLFRYSVDGELLSTLAIPLDDADYLSACAFDDRSFWYVSGWIEAKRTYRLMRMDLSDGSLTLDTALESLPEMPSEWSPSVMAIAGDGTVWMTSNGDTYAYGADLQSVYRVRAGTWISSMAVDPDGAVWACANYGADIGWGAAKLNRERGSYDEAIPLDAGTRTIAFAPDGTLWFDTADGVSRLVTGEDGSPTAEPVMNYVASGIIHTLSGVTAGGEHNEFLLAIAPDALLFLSNSWANERTVSKPMLYRPSDTEAPAEVIPLQLAFAGTMDDNIRAEVVRFNRDHLEAEISLLDYSIYDTDAQQKLMIDILNGIITPDMVYGYDGSVSIRTLRDKGLTVDLTPYLAADDTVNEETLFGSVLSYFRGRDGGIWGIAPYFSLHTLLSTTSLLRGYADADGWDLSAFFDFTASLPAEQVLTTNAVRGKYPLPMIGEQFVDRTAGTCSFDSPLYQRYLAFLDALPSEAEVRRIIPGMDPRRYYLEGKVALASGSLAGDSTPLEFESVFADPDYVIVGYPSEDPLHRANLSAEHTFVVTKTSEHPDVCWAFIRSTFRSQNEQVWMYGVGFSSLKTLFDADVQSMREHLMLHFSSGRWMQWPAAPDELEEVRDTIDQTIKSMGLSSMYGTYEAEPPDEEQIARVRAFLDAPVAPAYESLPWEVSSLIREEISSFLGGVGTAEDCAKKIQSRVSIWLAENR